MPLNPSVMQAIETLNYRVTVGDVASQAGLDLNIAEQSLLALASEAGGHLQVAESGDIAYQFPRNFRAVLRSKYLRLRLQEWWNKVWGVLFYLVRISFGIVLITSVILVFLAITILFIVISSQGNGDNRNDSSRGGSFPMFWISPDFFWIFSPNYSSRYGRRSYSNNRSSYRRRNNDPDTNQVNFLEAIFSFLFGDGNPNADLDQRRWQSIATVIRNHKGAVVAEQIAPYLDEIGQGFQQEYEEYMLPVLTRFNGRPEVSPEGQIIYHFPELQVTAAQTQPHSVMAYLKEAQWRFSQAGSGQIIGAVGLGGINLIGLLILGQMLGDGTIAAQIGGLVAFVAGIYWVLAVYAVGFLVIPLIRYFWIQQRNRRIEARNQQRQERAVALNEATPELQHKLAFAQQFAQETIVSASNLAYTTEKDLTQQEFEQADQIDAEWQRRLNSANDY